MENVKNSQELLDEFYKENPSKPKENPKPSKGKQRVRVLQSGRSIQIDPEDFKTLQNDTYVTTWPGSRLEEQNT